MTLAPAPVVVFFKKAEREPVRAQRFWSLCRGSIVKFFRAFRHVSVYLSEYFQPPALQCTGHDYQVFCIEKMRPSPQRWALAMPAFGADNRDIQSPPLLSILLSAHKKTPNRQANPGFSFPEGHSESALRDVQKDLSHVFSANQRAMQRERTHTLALARRQAATFAGKRAHQRCQVSAMCFHKAAYFISSALKVKQKGWGRSALILKRLMRGRRRSGRHICGSGCSSTANTIRWRW